MPVSSMTGFARASGERQGLFWQWEIKSVNGKALDVRLKLPPGCEALETPVRAALASAFRRGNLQVSLTVSGQMGRDTVRLNRNILDRLVEAGESLRDRIGGEPLRADVLLAIKGVVEVTAEPETEGEAEARNADMLASFDDALKALAAARREEGDRLMAVVSAQVQRIAELADAARRNPSRTPEAIRARLASQVNRLMETGAALDPDRLHQEAAIAAARADIEEELDRLASHVEAARALLASHDAVGRKFDFLAQEFNREANTLCSKASDRSLTAIGLDLKTVIDQLREQVQNIE
ncbi:YicC/YloC family endoribonuclease [Aestuariivirga sp.]|uniref:YicC/YloC family endoribonuclease n=1 Tax=Aestuariivirga sp. TaxID=2650926 RepID=UPI0025BF883C|nr:YicC/YloC family endoribonuclease [Aestuariivirga sp.]MCA3554110.1 YicC family protein [Aestuariivirga sp.]